MVSVGPPCISGVSKRTDSRFSSQYSVEITYGINSIISKLMTFVENAETGQFLFLVILILSYIIERGVHCLHSCVSAK
jgi:hypothetical protein